MLDRLTAMRLEMQLLNASAWRKLADGDGEGGFPELITKGSSKLDLVMLRATCPYLFGIWSRPLFTAQARLQPDSPLLHMLDETTLGLVFCFLTERELATSVAPTCTMFRASLFSKWHMESLLGGAMSSSIASALASGDAERQGPNIPQLADRLKELNHTVGMGFSQLAVAQDEAPQSPVEHIMCDLFHRVPDCQVRLRKLELALLARTSLQTHEKQVDALLAGCHLLLDPASPARRALGTLLSVGLAFGNRFGASTRPPQPTSPPPTVQTFVLTGLTQLHESKSRFHRQLTLAEVFVWLVGEAGAGEEEFASLEASLRMWNGPSANMIMEAATSTCHVLANLKDVELDLGGAQDNFHSRLDRVLRLFDAPCRELLAKIARARSQLAAVTKWLLPDSSGAFFAGKEITELYHFVRYCLDRMRSQEATCYELREQAWKNTALESSAIGKNASQRALRIQVQSEAEKSTAFVHARGAVNKDLSGTAKEEAAKQAREERMERVTETMQALSVEERAARENLLRSTLQFKPTLVREEVEEQEEEEREEEQPEEQQPEEPQPEEEQPELEEEKTDNGLKLWYWTSGYSPSPNSVWVELAPSLSDHDVGLITKLFSRGPEVHLTAATTHQRLKHFTSADFSNSKTVLTNSSVVDVRRTGKALDALPQVQQLGGSPAKPAAAAAAGRSDLPPVLPVFPLSRILELKQQGKLGTAQLQPQQLEWHLSEQEFAHCFAMPRQAFLALPAWKRDKAKKACGLF